MLSRENDRAEFAVRQSEKMCEENPCDRLATLRTGFDGFGSGWLKSFCDSLPAVSPEYARDFFVFSVDLDTNFDTGSEFGNIVLNSLYTVRKLDFLTLNPKFYEAVQAIPFSEWDRLEKRVKKVVGESKLNWTETFFSATKEILTIWDVKLIAISVNMTLSTSQKRFLPITLKKTENHKDHPRHALNTIEGNTCRVF
ncbi:MAG: hypothetical protein NTZ80_00660 [Patescibacteria group bacterium]|nr:hypothetical protein [Patescibacteria group bacterium]